MSRPFTTFPFQDQDFFELELTVNNATTNFSISFSPYTGTPSASNPMDYALTPVRVDWGDGTVGFATLAPASSTAHIYNATGLFTIKIWVKDFANLNGFTMNGLGSGGANGSLGNIDLSNFTNLNSISIYQGAVDVITWPSTIDTTNKGLQASFYQTDGLPTIIDWSSMTNGLRSIQLNRVETERVIFPPTGSVGLSSFLIQTDSVNGTMALGTGAAAGTVLDFSSITFQTWANLEIQGPWGGGISGWTSVTWPAVFGGDFRQLYIEDGSATTLDFSTVPFSSTYPSDVKFYCQGMPNLTSLTMPSVGQAPNIDWVVIGNNPLLAGVLDCSMFTNMHYFGFNDMPLMTGLTLPSSATVVLTGYAYVRDNPILGYVDFTVIPNCTDGNDIKLQLQDNNWSAANVNQILIDFDTISSLGPPYTGREIHIDGSNAAPTGAGITAVTNLTAKGFAVTHT